jgi:hypothetical protein
MKSSFTILSKGAFIFSMALAAGTVHAATVCIKNSNGKFESWQATSSMRGLPTVSPADCEARNNFGANAGKADALPTSVGKPGQSVSTLDVRPSTPQAAEAQTWSITRSDGTIWGALKRWSQIEKVQLDWDMEGKDFPVTLEATYAGDYRAAVGEVMKGLRHSDYPPRACRYENNAVRILHKSRKCEE